MVSVRRNCRFKLNILSVNQGLGSLHAIFFFFRGACLSNMVFTSDSTMLTNSSVSSQFIDIDFTSDAKSSGFIFLRFLHNLCIRILIKTFCYSYEKTEVLKSRKVCYEAIHSFLSRILHAPDAVKC